MTLRARLARRLRFLADRVDPRGAPRASHVTFTFEDGIGIAFRDDGRGCRVWHLGEDDYRRAHDDAGHLDLDHAWIPARRVTR